MHDITDDKARKIIADWIMNDSDQFDLDDFGYAAADDLLSKLRPAEPFAGPSPPNRSGPKKSDSRRAAERPD